jgi:hypothetical protein
MNQPRTEVGIQFFVKNILDPPVGWNDGSQFFLIFHFGQEEKRVKYSPFDPKILFLPHLLSRNSSAKLEMVADG